MPKLFEEVFITFRGEEQQSRTPYPKAWLFDNGWLRVEVPLEDGGTIMEYYSPCEIKSFYEA
ncbi:hypothetical protein [Natronorubrum halophilum]|uniref:hypothetical protein n=1 Tax=Natronorubrum halophilum TaxID=1702106 RepID=UPI0010C1B34D|nr:hypothetical protein [Natronorubrum halophilum]